METIYQIILTGVISGALSSLGTLAGIKVHIVYLRERTKENAEHIEKLYAKFDTL